MNYLNKIKFLVKTIIYACILTEIIVVETDIDSLSISTSNSVSIVEMKNNMPNEEVMHK